MEVDAVEHEIDLREFLVATDGVDHVEVCLDTVVGTCYDDGGIGCATQFQRIAYEADRRRVEHDEVVFCAQIVDAVVKHMTRDELRGVGRNDAGGQDVEVLVETAV